MKGKKTFKKELFGLLDHLSEYHPDIAPKSKDTINDLLEKYFYWVTEYNDGYSNELAEPDLCEFNAWLASEAEHYIY